MHEVSVKGRVSVVLQSQTGFALFGGVFMTHCEFDRWVVLIQFVFDVRRSFVGN